MVMLDRLFAVLSPRAALRRADRLAAGGRAGPAFRLYARAARAGLAEAEYRVARGYLEGSGVPPSQDEGVRWLERAATQGFVDAQARLAWMCVQGWARAEAPDAALTARPAASLFSANEPREPDFERAIAWARRAAEAGSPDGQVALAYILTSGPDAMRDLEEAHRWYEKAAASGSPQGALGYALSLARLAQSEDDQRYMVSHLRRAAEHGLPTALYLMGVLTDGGVGTERDPAEAGAVLPAGGREGQPQRAGALGARAHGGAGYRPQNTAAGESWLRRAALAGDAEAAALVGDLVCQGRSAAAQLCGGRAVVSPRRGCGARDRRPGARPSVSHRGRRGPRIRTRRRAGSGSPRKPGTATRKRTSPISCCAAPASPEDLVRTGRWFEEAAASGDLVAAFNFGVCLAKGFGVQRDEAAGGAMAASRGGRSRRTRNTGMARMLLEGRGVDGRPRGGRAPGWRGPPRPGMRGCPSGARRDDGEWPRAARATTEAALSCSRRRPLRAIAARCSRWAR